MRLLIERGADPNATDARGRTALMGAAGRGQLEMVKLLVSRGVNPRAEDKDGRSAAGYAALARAQDVVRYVQTLPH